MSGQTKMGRDALPPGFGTVLEVDLEAVAANYRWLEKQAPGAEIGAMVKADAYGLGAEMIAPVLLEAGCGKFFVATAREGLNLRRVVPHAQISVLNGYEPAERELFDTAKLTPALSSLAQIEAWRSRPDAAASALLHVDTGMNRLGLDADEMAAIWQDPGRIAGLNIECVMSHLACADDPSDPKNEMQLRRFREIVEQLSPLLVAANPDGVAASLANSSGIFLGPDYHFDLVRPGASLYGLSPYLDGPGSLPNPMRQVVHLYAKILQLRDVDTPETVGYGASHKIRGRRRLATISAGYADGYLRAISHPGTATPNPAKAGSGPGSGMVFFGDLAAPLVGRISMDLIAVDVTDVPRERCAPGSMVELIGDHIGVDDVARAAGTIGYEVITRLGPRSHRIYRGAPGSAELDTDLGVVK